MRAPSLGVGEAALAVGREPSHQGRWHVLLTHIGERLVIDDIVGEPSAQAFEEVDAALRIGRPEPSETIVADPRADRVAPLVAPPGVIDAQPGRVRKSGAIPPMNPPFESIRVRKNSKEPPCLNLS